MRNGFPWWWPRWSGDSLSGHASLDWERHRRRSVEGCYSFSPFSKNGGCFYFHLHTNWIMSLTPPTRQTQSFLPTHPCAKGLHCRFWGVISGCHHWFGDGLYNLAIRPEPTYGKIVGKFSSPPFQRKCCKVTASVWCLTNWPQNRTG